MHVSAAFKEAFWWRYKLCLMMQTYTAICTTCISNGEWTLTAVTLWLVESPLVVLGLSKPGDASLISGESLPCGRGPVRGCTDLEMICRMAWRGPEREESSSSRDGVVVSDPACIHVCVCVCEYACMCTCITSGYHYTCTHMQDMLIHCNVHIQS